MAEALNNLWLGISQSEIRLLFQILLVMLIFGGLISINSNKKLIAVTTYRSATLSLSVIFVLYLILWLILLLDYLIPFIQYEAILSLTQFVYAFSALWAIWIWCFPATSQNADLIKTILTIALVLLLGIQCTFLLFSNSTYNQALTYLNIIWYLLAFSILSLSLIIITFNHKENWIIGTFFIMIELAGIIMAWLVKDNSQGDLTVILLLAELISYPLLPTLSKGLIFSETAPEKHQPSFYLPIANKDMVVIPDQTILQSWLSLILKNHEVLLENEVLQNLKDVFHADYSFLVTNNSKDQIILHAGVTKKSLGFEFPFTCKQNNLITIQKALLKNQPFSYIKDDYFPTDVQEFLQSVRIKSPINILFFPISSVNKSINKFAFLFMSANVFWGKPHLKYLYGIRDELTQILQKLFPQKADIKESGTTEEQLKGQKDLLSKISIVETQQQTIDRLEAELQLTLEDYARVKRLLEVRGSNLHSTDD